jgi:hypothetical protein
LPAAATEYGLDFEETELDEFLSGTARRVFKLD